MTESKVQKSGGFSIKPDSRNWVEIKNEKCDLVLILVHRP